MILSVVSDEEYGNPIYPPAKRCLTQHGIPFDSTKTARTVTKADYDSFDSIICMDSSNLRWLHGIIGDDPAMKVHLMMSYTGSGRDVTHCKNLFMRNHKGNRHYLISMPGSITVFRQCNDRTS